MRTGYKIFGALRFFSSTQNKSYILTLIPFTVYSSHPCDSPLQGLRLKFVPDEFLPSIVYRRENLPGMADLVLLSRDANQNDPVTKIKN